MKKFLFLLLLLPFLCWTIHAQLSPSIEKQIDSLFADWDLDTHPGGAVGIAMDGEVVYSKAFGLANLEYSIPNTPDMRFNIASVSKQMTAMGIVLLHLEGKLSVDDEIQKYLVNIPQFEHKITIRHMLHHTSGLRSLHAIMALAGWRGDDYRTNSDLMRLMKNQKDLNFIPGDEYLYCNTGYMFMAEIIEEITGSEFTAWMKKNVFDPLGMKDTYVERKYNRVVPRNATSYSYFGNLFELERNTEYWGYVGSGNVHSTATDLLKWLTNFHTPKEGWEKAFEMMQTLDPFNDGSLNNYAFGVNIGALNSHKRIQHGGSIGGYRANAASFPDDRLDIAIVSNYNRGNPGAKSNAIATILFDDPEIKEEKKPFDLMNDMRIPEPRLKGFEGNYWNDKENYSRKIELEDDTLRYIRTNNTKSPLVPISGNEFLMLGVDVKLIVRFKKDAEGNKIMEVEEEGQRPSKFEEYEAYELNFEDVLEYSGMYWSPELETMYRIYSKGDGLMVHHVRHGDFELRLLKRDVFEGQWPFGVVKVSRNVFGDVEGILVSNGRVRNLWLEKKR